MNKELLLKVKAHILAEPKRLNMSTWLITKEMVENAALHVRVNWPECGTVGCIAGWTCQLGTELEPKELIKIISGTQTTATKLLDITLGEAASLFFTDNWPYELAVRYNSTTDQTEQAKIVGEVIDNFISMKEEGL